MTDADFLAFMREHGGPAVAEVAHAFLAEIERRGLLVDTTASNLMVKLRDPNESGKVFTLFGISKQGFLWVERLPEQWIAAGIEYRGSPAETFLTDLSRLLGRELRLQKGKAAPDYWGKNIPFSEARPHLRQVLEVLDAFLDAVSYRRPGQSDAEEAPAVVNRPR